MSAWNHLTVIWLNSEPNSTLPFHTPPNPLGNGGCKPVKSPAVPAWCGRFSLNGTGGRWWSIWGLERAGRVRFYLRCRKPGGFSWRTVVWVRCDRVDLYDRERADESWCYLPNSPGKGMFFVDSQTLSPTW